MEIIYEEDATTNDDEELTEKDINEKQDGVSDEESSVDTDEELDDDACENNLGDIRVNESFTSFKLLRKRVKNYQDFSNSVFYKRDCKTIKRARKIGVKRHIEACLKYYSIHYHCIHGGEKFQSKATGQRSSSTFQNGCEAGFNVNVSKDGMSLYIKNTNLQHNHERIKELYHHLPQVRKMTPKLKQKVKGLLKLKANKTRIQDLISKETGKVVLLKDIHNLNYTGEEKE
ncbi:hypothetical protein KQX54_018761 [Cotesia glomerata]|uniref:ZSWIM3 N-terminal domain-containing protein n=1 Tax=Cotesia glomerata TaxID=32391 RepID=A0AAV7IP51_COTGL|nr:hypothetical protein KQX54_018761 [Cotesia glomerata]